MISKAVSYTHLVCIRDRAQGEWALCARYAIPILAFAAGIFLAQKIRYRCVGKGEDQKRKGRQTFHWRQLVLLLEILVLFAAGFLPEGMSLPANALVSFSCALQVDSFKKIRGNAMATTMCIGNLRSATDLLCAYTAVSYTHLRRSHRGGALFG